MYTSRVLIIYDGKNYEYRLNKFFYLFGDVRGDEPPITGITNPLHAKKY